MTTSTLADDHDGPRIHAERTADLSSSEKNIFNDGYLYASADAVEVIAGILDEPGLTDAERLDLFSDVVGQMSLPLLIASLATGKQFLK